MRLIDADALKEHLDYVCVGGGKWGDAEKAFIIAFKDFVDGEITVEPQRTGKWTEAYEDYRKQIGWWECSECKYAVSWRANYCPDCGAHMIGEEE